MLYCLRITLKVLRIAIKVRNHLQPTEDTQQRCQDRIEIQRDFVYRLASVTCLISYHFFQVQEARELAMESDLFRHSYRANLLQVPETNLVKSRPAKV